MLYTARTPGPSPTAIPSMFMGQNRPDQPILSPQNIHLFRPRCTPYVLSQMPVPSRPVVPPAQRCQPAADSYTLVEIGVQSPAEASVTGQHEPVMSKQQSSHVINDNSSTQNELSSTLQQSGSASARM